MPEISWPWMNNSISYPWSFFCLNDWPRRKHLARKRIMGECCKTSLDVGNWLWKTNNYDTWTLIICLLTHLISPVLNFREVKITGVGWWNLSKSINRGGGVLGQALIKVEPNEVKWWYGWWNRLMRSFTAWIHQYNKAFVWNVQIFSLEY